MAIPCNKHSLLEAIRVNYSKLRAELEPGLSAVSESKELPAHAANTAMSLNNLLSYLLGWGQLVLKWVDKKERGEAVDFPETGYRWNELGSLAQKFYRDYDNDDYHTLCKKLDTTVDTIVQLIESKTDEELYGSPWYNQWTLGRMIQLNTSSPYSNARQRIRKWKKIRIEQEQLS